MSRRAVAPKAPASRMLPRRLALALLALAATAAGARKKSDSDGPPPDIPRRALKTIDATIAQCEQSLAGLRDRGSGNLATAKTLQDRLAQMRTRRRAITDVVRREARAT